MLKGGFIMFNMDELTFLKIENKDMPNIKGQYC